MRKSTYKLIDLTIFTAIVCVIEAVNILVLKHIFESEIFSLSLVVPIALIVMARWNAWGVVPAVLAGIVYCACAGGTGYLYLVYGAGNVGVLAGLIFFKAFGRERTVKNYLLVIGYTLSAFIAVNLLRAGLAVITPLSSDFGSVLTAYLGTDALNAVIGLFIMIIASRQNGLMENQYKYIERIQKELKEREGIYG